MEPSEVLAHPAILQAAWLRIRTWYQKGEWVPQPEYAKWEFDPQAELDQLGSELSSGTYRPQPMQLIPHAKKKGRLRHYCRPSVRDQVAFTVFGTLLAPLLEENMFPFSFGNRWYQGLTRKKEGSTNRWQSRNWSLADREIYQPYRRAHGLFRRVASWTVNSMLGTELPAESSIGPVTQPSDFGNQLLPSFAQKSYWQNYPRTERVSWARFDLKLAYPSVKIECLRTAMKALALSVFNNPYEGLQEISFLLFSEKLRLIDSSVRVHLLQEGSVIYFIDYLCDLLAAVRYVPFAQSDELYFPEDADSPSLLPRGDGSIHPGIPTGLAISGMLLNVYLHRIDSSMAEWFRERPPQSELTGQPAAFLRFADDMVLLAANRRVLSDGIDHLIGAIENPDGTEELNLAMNWEKAEPTTVAAMLKEFRKPTRSKKNSLSKWTTKGKGKDLLDQVDSSAITEETRGPFVTELVERFSDLGSEKQFDLLPEQAKVRLSALTSPYNHEDGFRLAAAVNR